MSYIHRGKLFEFNVSEIEVYVEFDLNEKVALEKQNPNDFHLLSDKSAILSTKNLKGTFENRKQILLNDFSNQLKRIDPVLIYQDGTRQIAMGELNIRFKTKGSLNNILKGIEFSFEQNQFDDNLYSVKTNLSTNELFELVTKLQDNSQIEFIEPNFIRLIKPQTSDPYYGSQWSINNQGYLGGTVDADMDVDEAWAFSTGSGINVAIIDEGVDLTHTDLTSNLLTGYDATGNGSNGAPNETNNDYHGTACAGIVGAIANNSSGTAGVAYDSKIIPVRIGYTNGYPLGSIYRALIAYDNWIANGINWAWQNGADILSNSWGGGSDSSTINNAISNAVNNGRNGKGCLVFFATGNENYNVIYPATLENVIAVGATSMCDERKRSTDDANALQNLDTHPDPNGTSCDGEWWWGSNYGNEIDLVAPGVQIYTTDISGTYGRDVGDYNSHFNGTSSACPNAAGVAALILSAKPSLTQQQARTILETSTDKVSGYTYSTTSGHSNGTWNIEMGYGRINAKKALTKALFENTYISGASSVCNSNTTFNLVNAPSGFAVSWQVSSNLQIISSTNTQVVIKASSSTASGSGYVKAVISGYQITKNVNVGTYLPLDLRLRDPNTNYPVYVICYLQSTTVKATHDDGFVPDSWQWSVSGASVSYPYGSSGSLATLHPYSYNIIVKVKAHNSCGWSDWADVSPDVMPCGSMYFTVSPNPAQSEITINKSSNETDNSEDNDMVQYSSIEIELYEMNGNKINHINFSKNDHMKINVSALKKGIYFLKIIAGDIQETHQVIIN